MSANKLLTCWTGVVLLFLFFVANPSQALGEDLKVEAILVWGTNDATSPNPKHKPVGPRLAKKLQSLPFKWANYFEVNCKQIVVPHSAEKKERMSQDCEIKVKNLGKSVVEVSLIGKGEPVGKITQALPKGELLVTGGNAENFTAWFVVLKQVE